LSVKKILVIEDDKDIRRVLEVRLEMEGFEVITASDGIEGIAKAKAEGPDLILLDLKLPGMPGEQICRDLRKDVKYKNLPIIMITGKAADADRVIGKVIGANCYMVKPFDIDELLVNINSMIK